MIQHFVYTFIICLLTVESVAWSYVICNFAYWAHKLKRTERRNVLSKQLLCFFAITSAVFSFYVWYLFIYYSTFIASSFNVSINVTFIVASLFQIVAINSWFLLANYIGIGLDTYPYISTCVVKVLSFILRKLHLEDYFNLKMIGAFNVYNTDALIVNFYEEVPFYIFVEDVHSKLIYANRSACNNLFLLDSYKLVGKSLFELEQLYNKNNKVTTLFKSIIHSSDLVRKELRPMTFFEQGVVDNKYRAYRVFKAPIFDSGDVFIGVISFYFDITFHAENIESIYNNIIEGNYSKALSSFMVYKHKFDNLEEYPETFMCNCNKKEHIQIDY